MFSERFVCEERRGTRVRLVIEVFPSLSLEQYLFDRIPQRASPLKDIELIWSDTVRLFLVDDVGVLMKGPLEFQGMPDVHVVFWDKVLVGRESMCRSVAQRVAEDCGAKGVFTATPLDARTVIAFAKRMGFQQVSEANGVVVLSMLFT